ncbi:hypothetical protein VTN96DRAFT_2457 [Rasamsonia emersonii]
MGVGNALLGTWTCRQYEFHCLRKPELEMEYFTPIERPYTLLVWDKQPVQSSCGFFFLPIIYFGRSINTQISSTESCDWLSGRPSIGECRVAECPSSARAHEGARLLGTVLRLGPYLPRWSLWRSLPPQNMQGLFFFLEKGIIRGEFRAFWTSRGLLSHCPGMIPQGTGRRSTNYSQTLLIMINSSQL